MGRVQHDPSRFFNGWLCDAILFWGNTLNSLADPAHRGRSLHRLPDCFPKTLNPEIRLDGALALGKDGGAQFGEQLFGGDGAIST